MSRVWVFKQEDNDDGDNTPSLAASYHTQTAAGKGNTVSPSVMLTANLRISAEELLHHASLTKHNIGRECRILDSTLFIDWNASEAFLRLFINDIPHKEYTEDTERWAPLPTTVLLRVSPKNAQKKPSPRALPLGNDTQSTGLYEIEFLEIPPLPQRFVQQKAGDSRTTKGKTTVRKIPSSTRGKENNTGILQQRLQGTIRILFTIEYIAPLATRYETPHQDSIMLPHQSKAPSIIHEQAWAVLPVSVQIPR